MLCPGDGAKVIEVTYTVQTTGGDAQNHDLILEHGLAGAGAALTATTSIANDNAAGVISTFPGLDTAGQPNTVLGTMIQVQATEAGAISNGLILDISVLWEL